MTVLFDLDGTLLDTAPDLILPVNTLLNEIGQTAINLETFKPAISHGLEEIIWVCFKIKSEHPDYPALSNKLLAYYENSICLHTKPFPGILNLLQALDNHQIPWGIVTNRLGHSTEKLLVATGLKDRAACIVCGDSTPNPKPHPAPLLLACKQMTVSPAECIYVGDAERDIQAGKAAGMATLGVLFGYIPDIQTALAWTADDYVHHADEILEKILLFRARQIN